MSILSCHESNDFTNTGFDFGEGTMEELLIDVNEGTEVTLNCEGRDTVITMNEKSAKESCESIPCGSITNWNDLFSAIGSCESILSNDITSWNDNFSSYLHNCAWISIFQQSNLYSGFCSNLEPSIFDDITHFCEFFLTFFSDGDYNPKEILVEYRQPSLQQHDWRGDNPCDFKIVLNGSNIGLEPAGLDYSSSIVGCPRIMHTRRARSLAVAVGSNYAEDVNGRLVVITPSISSLSQLCHDDSESFKNSIHSKVVRPVALRSKTC